MNLFLSVVLRTSAFTAMFWDNFLQSIRTRDSVSFVSRVSASLWTFTSSIKCVQALREIFPFVYFPDLNLNLYRNRVKPPQKNADSDSQWGRADREQHRQVCASNLSVRISPVFLFLHFSSLLNTTQAGWGRRSPSILDFLLKSRLIRRGSVTSPVCGLQVCDPVFRMNPPIRAFRGLDR